MPYTHTIEGRIIHIAWSGRITKDDLAKLGRELKLTDEDVEALVFNRDKTPARPVSFE